MGLPNFEKVRYIVGIGFIFFAWLNNSLAQRWTLYSTPHGLAGGEVRDILVDRNGELWFATDNGVSRYDGKWASFRADKYLESNSVRAIARNDDGEIWFGTDEGISKINLSSDLENPDNWKRYTVANTDSGLASNKITAILFDRKGQIWFGTVDGGISVADPTPDVMNPSQDPLRNPENWVTYTEKDGLGSNTIWAVEMDKLGNIWSITGTRNPAFIKVYEQETQKWKSFSLKSDAERPRVVFKDREGNIWIGTNLTGLYKVHPDNLSNYDEHYTNENTSGGLAANNIIAITQDSSNAMWFGHTVSGVSMALPHGDLTDSTNWKHFTTLDGLAENFVAAIVEDEEENVWFGHPERRGTSQLDRTWLAFLTQRGSQLNSVTGLFPDKQRFLWIATTGGVVRVHLDANLLLDKNLNDIFSKSNSGLGSNQVFCVFQDSKLNLWFGTEVGANRVVVSDLRNPNRWAIFNQSTGFSFNKVVWITEDRLGYLWLSTNVGVSRVHVDSTELINSWRQITQSSGLASNNVNEILPAKNGILWFGTDRGVSSIDPAANPLDPANWKNYNTTHGLANNLVNSIFEDKAGSLWFATQSGVSRVEVDAKGQPLNWTNYTTENTQGGLVSYDVSSITQSAIKEDEFWFGTPLGASRLDLKMNRWTVFTTASSGLKANFITSLFTDRDRGDIWFGTLEGGATRYRPKKKPPVTFIDINYDVVTGNFITFNFRGADIITPDHELRFQYRLDDENWRETSDKSATVLAKDSDKPQRHVFQVRAIDRDGNVDQTPATDVFYKIDARLGGNVEITDADNRVRLYVPPGVLRGDTSITIASVKRFDAADSVIVAYDFSPKPFKLTRPATLSISFPNTQAASHNQTAIFRRDNSSWTGVGGTVASEGNLMTVSTAITELDTFAVRNIRVSQSERAVAEVNIQPRVFSPAGGGRGHGDRANISFDLQNEAMVSVKVYDLAGRLKKVVKENVSLAAGVNVVAWDGRDDDGRLCVSGLYVVTIEAQGSVQTKTVVVANDR